MIQVLVIGTCAGLAIFALWSLIEVLESRRQQRIRRDSEYSRQIAEKDPYQNIQPLPDFNWAETRPIQNAVFKPKYHLTMGT